MLDSTRRRRRGLVTRNPLRQGTKNEEGQKDNTSGKRHLSHLKTKTNSNSSRQTRTAMQLGRFEGRLVCRRKKQATDSELPEMGSEKRERNGVAKMLAFLEFRSLGGGGKSREKKRITEEVS